MKQWIIKSRLTGEIISVTPASESLELSESELQEYLKSSGLLESISEPIKVFEQGHGFRQAAIHLRNCKSQSAGESNLMIVPAITLSCFAIELFLKAIALEHGQKLKGHNVFELFEALPVLARDMLVSIDTDARLPGALKSIGESFVNWRYVHEHQTMEMDIADLEFAETLTFNAARALVYKALKE